MSTSPPNPAQITPAIPGRRCLYGLAGPTVLLAAAMALHVSGRVAAFCCPFKVDSYYYTISACKLYDDMVTFDDLIPDKPPGQALLTGWVYRIWPEPPSRLAMVPVESAFMLAGFAAFWVLARRLFGDRLAAALSLFVVVAENTYNGLDIITDGFGLGENYLILPVALAVLAHLAICSPLRRGLIRGLGMGVALSIKQTAGGLLLVLVVHGLWRTVARRQWASGLRSAGGSAAGLAIGVLPVVVFLLYRGWLGDHVHDLLSYSGGHLKVMPFRVPRWYRLAPLLPLGWWILLGLVTWAICRSKQPEETSPVSVSGLRSFVGLWLAVELPILWAMNKPATHYYQPLVIPVALAAGMGAWRVHQTLARCRLGDRIVVRRWLALVTAMLAIAAALPMTAAAAKRVHGFDYEAEIAEFQHYLDTWSPAEAALYKPRKE